jgi:mannose-6-phosphate isomerase-like protein (cupin superfamily)
MRRIRCWVGQETALREFETLSLGAHPDATAPDGTAVRLLLALAGGSLAHFELPAGAVSHAVTHKTVEEIWYFLGGRGEIWRWSGARESVVAVEPGVCLTIPLGTAFQFRGVGEAPLTFLAITMPPWPGAQEADRVEGRWMASMPDA